MRMPIPVPSRLFTAWATTPGPIGPVATEQLGVDHADDHGGDRREVGAVDGREHDGATQEPGDLPVAQQRVHHDAAEQQFLTDGVRTAMNSSVRTRETGPAAPVSV